MKTRDAAWIAPKPCGWPPGVDGIPSARGTTEQGEGMPAPALRRQNADDTVNRYSAGGFRNLSTLSFVTTSRPTMLMTGTCLPCFSADRMVMAFWPIS